ncbi:hypothetical protein [Vreelandella populi]|uniref:Uncharacterized protein n=1 Tax=Vreelandella populi TaxID=2498858 RepID=A0A433LG97_9GAMM|nr:hypothetical protein [Halomonas populi]RUR48821.1 hypothetical protein ELY37_02930 [Halomonas populi]
MMGSEIRWGWVDRDGCAQTKTYATAEAAIEEMNRRQGEELAYEKHAEVGYRLARVKVTVEVLAVMTPMNELEAKL